MPAMRAKSNLRSHRPSAKLGRPGLHSVEVFSLSASLEDRPPEADLRGNAVASNLNVWGSYIWAHRLENFRTYLGHYNSLAMTASGPFERAPFQTNLGWTPGAGTGPYGYVPNGYLGWELGLGIDWKLLEGLTYRARYAYWQPGDWFNYAYQAVTPLQVTGTPWNGVTFNGYLGTRDTIHAFEGNLIIDF